jgi:peptidoglycan/xylan/chitin deacetylase (PgdA/CDA1 family)
LISSIKKIIAVLALSAALGAPSVLAGGCTGNSAVLGTSRVLTVDPAEHKRVGTLQYADSLPLAEHEVVLTFDDGPLAAYTPRILDALAAECVKATFFMIGRMAKADPQLVQRVAKEGHTIGSHTQNHPMNIRFLGQARVAEEIDSGIETISAALGETKPLAPFFRIPGLYSSQAIEDYAAARGLTIWSADLHASDWERVGPGGVIGRTLHRLQSKRKGILLLHDIQPATALALPQLLKQLRLHGYRVVHVVPAVPERSKTPADPPQEQPAGSSSAAR